MHIIARTACCEAGHPCQSEAPQATCSESKPRLYPRGRTLTTSLQSVVHCRVPSTLRIVTYLRASLRRL